MDVTIDVPSASSSPFVDGETLMSVQISFMNDPWSDFDTSRSSSTWHGGRHEMALQNFLEPERCPGTPDSDPGSQDNESLAHEERRNNERFASFPKSKSRRRNKSKPDSPGRNQSSSKRETDSLPRSNTTVESIPIPKAERNLASLFDSMDREEPVASRSLGPAATDDAPLSADFSPRLQSEILRSDYQPKTQLYKVRRFTVSPTTATLVNKSENERIHVLEGEISRIREEIRLYEESFATQFGFRPSYHQKMNDEVSKKMLIALETAQKELKVFKAKKMSVTSEEFCDSQPFRRRRGSGPSFEDIVQKILEHLEDSRDALGVPETCDLMTKEQLVDEKQRLQRALLHLETSHGRPLLRTDKELVKPLYNRYRLLKRLVIRSGMNFSKDNAAELMPILEHEPLEFNNEHTWPRSTPTTHQMSLMSESEESLDDKVGCDTKRRKFDFAENLHALPLSQLLERLHSAREEKRRLRRSMRDAAQFNLERLSADTDDPDDTYSRYKHAKAKIRLLDALVAKHQRSASF